jgi:hypothetical protein
MTSVDLENIVILGNRYYSEIRSGAVLEKLIVAQIVK